jgi:hypothetical protein
VDGIHIVRQGGGVRDYLFIQEGFTISTRHYPPFSRGRQSRTAPFSTLYRRYARRQRFSRLLIRKKSLLFKKELYEYSPQLKEVGPREAFLLLCIYEYRPGNAGRHRSQFLSQFCMDGGRRSTPEISGSPEKHGRGMTVNLGR